MQEIKGNIWALAHFLRDSVCVPVNCGWRRDGCNVMGRGIAKTVAYHDKSIPAWYGDICKQHNGCPPLVQKRFRGPFSRHWNMLFVPTKPCNLDMPHLSWQGDATLERVEQSLKELQHFVPPKPDGRILVPILGTGWGRLTKRDVRPLMDRYLTAPHFVRVNL
jgi:hypothetical protein